jgi:membrane associated rhomboid family serine protease
MGYENEHILTDEPDWVIIDPATIISTRKTLTAQQARLWSLVLDSRSLPYRLQEISGEWSLHTPPDKMEVASIELRCFERENLNWPPSPLPSRPLVENNLATLSILLLLATFHNITSLELRLPFNWLESGSARADRILDGEWWRLITALTLHHDVVHLLSNLCIGGIFVLLLCRELGSGLSWTLLLAAGAGGNLLNAFMHGGTHNSVGASTAVFAAVGILASLNLKRNHNRRWALPVAAALALLAILGTEGKQTDLGAHLFGFVCGITLGLVTERFIEKYGQPKPLLNILLAMLSGIIVVAAWLAAVGTG